MITHERWKNIKTNDYVWFGRQWRRVIKTFPVGKPTYSIQFYKIDSSGLRQITVYHYSDICKKIKGICKIKRWKTS